MNNGMRSLEELLAVWRQVEENIEGLFVLSEEAILELFRSTCRCILGDAHWHANAGRGALEAVVNRTAMRLNANYKNPIIQRWPSLLRFASASHWNDTNLRVILRGDATKTFAFNFLGHEGPVAIVRLEIMVQNIDWKPAIALSDFVRDILEDIGQPGQEFRASLDLASRNAFDMLRCRILWGSRFHKDLANELLKLPQVRRDVIVKELSEDLSSERVPSGGIPPMDLELYRFLTSHFLSDVLLNAPDLDIRWIDEIIDLWMTVEANFSDPIDSLLEATDNPSFLVRVVLRMLARKRDVSECVLMTAKVGHCLKSAIEHDREHGSYRSGLAEILEVLGLEIFPEFPFVARECVLSAFSMSPTKERLGRIEEFTFFPETTSSCESSSTERLNGASFPPVMAPRCTQAMDPGGLSEHRSTLEFGSLINGSEGCETTPMSFEEAAEGLQEALVTHEPCVIGHDTRALCSVFGYRVSRSAQFRPASSSAKFVESNHIVDALMNGLGIVSEQLIFDVIALIDDCRDHCLSWTLGSKDLLRACEEYLIRDVCREMGVHSPVYSLPPSPAASSDIVSSPDRLTYDGMESGFDDSSIFSDDSSVEGYDGDGDDEVTLESDFADRSVAEASEIEDEASVKERWIAPEHEIQSGHSKPSSIPAESSEPEIETMEVTEAVSDDGHGWDQPSTSAAILEPPVKRRRGRPPKLPQKVLPEALDSSGSPRPEKPARGRFSEPSTDNLQEGISQESVAQPGRGRGRPKKNVPKFGKEPTPPRQDKPASPLMPPPSSVVVRTTRGRPPKVSKRELKNVSDSEEDVKEPPDPRKKKRHKAEPRASTEEVLFRVDSDSGLESGATSERGESVGAVDSHSPGKRPKIAKVLKTRRLTVPPEATPMLPSMSTASGKTLDDGWEFSFVNPSERRQGLTEKVTDLPLDVTQRSKQSSFAEQIRHSQSRSYTIVATALTTAAASSTTGNASGVLDGAGNGESGNGSGVNDDGSSTHGNELAANSFGSDAAGNGVCSLSSGSDGQITTTSSVIKVGNGSSEASTSSRTISVGGFPVASSSTTLLAGHPNGVGLSAGLSGTGLQSPNGSAQPFTTSPPSPALQYPQPPPTSSPRRGSHQHPHQHHPNQSPSQSQIHRPSSQPAGFPGSSMPQLLVLSPSQHSLSNGPGSGPQPRTSQPTTIPTTLFQEATVSRLEPAAISATTTTATATTSPPRGALVNGLVGSTIHHLPDSTPQASQLQLGHQSSLQLQISRTDASPSRVSPQQTQQQPQQAEGLGEKLKRLLLQKSQQQQLQQQLKMQAQSNAPQPSGMAAETTSPTKPKKRGGNGRERAPTVRKSRSLIMQREQEEATNSTPPCPSPPVPPTSTVFVSLGGGTPMHSVSTSTSGGIVVNSSASRGQIMGVMRRTPPASGTTSTGTSTGTTTLTLAQLLSSAKRGVATDSAGMQTAQVILTSSGHFAILHPTSTIATSTTSGTSVSTSASSLPQQHQQQQSFIVARSSSGSQTGPSSQVVHLQPQHQPHQQQQILVSSEGQSILVRTMSRSVSVPANVGNIGVTVAKSSVGSQASVPPTSVIAVRPQQQQQVAPPAEVMQPPGGMSSETLEGLMEFESIFSEIKEAEEKKRRQQQQQVQVRPQVERGTQMQQQVQVQQQQLIQVQRQQQQQQTPEPQQQPQPGLTPRLQQTTPVPVVMNKTIVNVKLPDETQIRDIPDDSQVTLNVHNGTSVQAIRLLGSVLKQEVLRNNPGLANGSHSGPLVLAVMMPTPVPATAVPRVAQQQLLQQQQQQQQHQHQHQVSPLPQPPQVQQVQMVKAMSTGGQTAVVATSSSSVVTVQPSSPTVPNASAAPTQPSSPSPMFVQKREGTQDGTGPPVVVLVGSESKGTSPQPPPPPIAVKTVAIGSKPVVTPNKDDPEVVKKVHQILESYQEQVRMSPEEQFRPAPRRNSLPKETGPPSSNPSSSGRKSKKGPGSSASSVTSANGTNLNSNSSNSAMSPPDLMSGSETSERAPSVASDSNLSSDGFQHLVSAQSPTPSIGSTIDVASVEKSLELQQQQQLLEQSIAHSAGSPLPESDGSLADVKPTLIDIKPPKFEAHSPFDVKPQIFDIKPAVSSSISVSTVPGITTTSGLLVTAAQPGVPSSSTTPLTSSIAVSASLPPRTQYIAIQSNSSGRPTQGGTVVLVQSKNSPNLQALLAAGKMTLPSVTQLGGTQEQQQQLLHQLIPQQQTSVNSPSLEELLSRPPLPIQGKSGLRLTGTSSVATSTSFTSQDPSLVPHVVRIKSRQQVACQTPQASLQPQQMVVKNASGQLSSPAKKVTLVSGNQQTIGSIEATPIDSSTSTVSLLPSFESLQRSDSVLPTFEALRSEGRLSTTASAVPQVSSVISSRVVNEAGVQTAKFAGNPPQQQQHQQQHIIVPNRLLQVGGRPGTKVVLMRDVGGGSLQPITEAELASINTGDLTLEIGRLVNSTVSAGVGPNEISLQYQQHLQQQGNITATTATGSQAGLGGITVGVRQQHAMVGKKAGQAQIRAPAGVATGARRPTYQAQRQRTSGLKQGFQPVASASSGMMIIATSPRGQQMNTPAVPVGPTHPHRRQLATSGMQTTDAPPPLVANSYSSVPGSSLNTSSSTSTATSVTVSSSEDLLPRPLAPPSPPKLPPIPSPEDALMDSLDFLFEPEHKAITTTPVVEVKSEPGVTVKQELPDLLADALMAATSSTVTVKEEPPEGNEPDEGSRKRKNSGSSDSAKSPLLSQVKKKR